MLNEMSLKQPANHTGVTFQCVAAPSEPPGRSAAALLQQESRQKELWGKGN